MEHVECRIQAFLKRRKPIERETMDYPIDRKFVAVFTSRDDDRPGFAYGRDETVVAERAFLMTNDKTVMIYKIHAKARNNVAVEKIE